MLQPPDPSGDRPPEPSRPPPPAGPPPPPDPAAPTRSPGAATVGPGLVLSDAGGGAGARDDASAARLLLRREFGKYQLLRELGRGGMGVVYQAWRPDLKAAFAVKVLLAGADASPEARERFQREAQASARLRHPGIVTVHDVGIEDGKPYYAMDFIEGVGLDRVLDDPARAGLAPRPGRRGLAPRDAARLVAAVALAIEHAHGCGVVHRDLKPANVLLDRAGRPHVVDFGLAKLFEQDGTTHGAGRTRTGTVLGTLAYMPPEQAGGEVDRIDARSDVYALGAMLYELVTGQVPFRAGTEAELLMRVLLHEPVRPRTLDPAIPADLETVLRKAMEKDPARRYPAAAELAEDLERFLDGQSVRARPPSVLHQAHAWVRRRPGLAVAALALVFAGAVAAVSAGSLRSAHREKLHLQAQVLAQLREKAGIYVDAALTLRRSGLAMKKAEEEYLPQLRRAVDQAVAADPARAEPHFHLGRMYRALMRFDEAAAEQDRALALDPDYAPSRYERAVLGARAYAARLAQARLQALASLGADLARAGVLARGGMAGQAVEVPGTEALEAQDPEARRLRERLEADLARLAGGAAAASPVGAGAGTEAESGELAPAHLACARGLALARSARTAAEVAEARRTLETVVRAAPLLEEAHEGLAILALDAGRWDDAITAYTRGLTVDAGYIPFWIGRAIARGEWGNLKRKTGEDPSALYEETRGDLTRALELDPRLSDAWFQRATLGLNWGVYRQGRGGDPGAYYGAAVADFGQALALEPKSAVAWAGRGQTRANGAVYDLARGRDPAPLFRQALADFDRALELAPGAADVWTERAIARANWGADREARGDDPRPLLAAAEEDLTRALEHNPAAVDAWYERGSVRRSWGGQQAERGEDPEPLYAAAAADLERALALAPESAPTWEQRAVVQLSWGNWDKARGREPDARLRTVVADTTRALALNPNFAEALENRARALCNLGVEQADRGADPVPFFERALADLGRAVELNPAAVSAWLARGSVRAAWASVRRNRGADPADQAEAALGDYGRGLALNPASAEACLGRAQVREIQGTWRLVQGADPGPCYEPAIADYGKALELNPAAAAAWKGRGSVRANWVIYRAGRGEDAGDLATSALADFGRALALNPGWAEVWVCRAVLRINWGDARLQRGADPGALFDEAAADYEKACALNPGWAAVWSGRALANVARGMLQQRRGQDPAAAYAAALADYGKALALNGRDAEIHWRRGQLLLQMDRCAEAIEDFEAARRLDPGSERNFAQHWQDARARLAAQHGGGAVEPALESLRRAEAAIAAQRYAEARSAYEEGLPQADAALAAAAADGQSRLRPLVQAAHYNLACIYALASAGRAAPGAPAVAVEPAEAARLRDRAFAGLGRAVDLGWHDRAHLERDEDLAALRADDRWTALLARIK